MKINPIINRGVINGITAAVLLLSGLLPLNVVADDFNAINNPSLIPTPRIVGGAPTGIELVPATVALLRSARVNLDGNLFQAQFCGGTAIADQWILTAAHCVLDVFGRPQAPSEILVLAGSEDLDNPINQPIEVEQIIAHPDYRSVELGSDIALLRLSTAVTTTPIALDTAPILLNDLAFIAGWGAIDAIGDERGQSFPKLLRGTFVNMTPGDQCAVLFPEYSDYANSTMVCAGVPEGGRDSCQGDSGGPLYRVDASGTAVTALSGITSWGISCGLAETPGIYTNVSAYIDWIQTNLRSTRTDTTPVIDDQPQNDEFLPVETQPEEVPPIVTPPTDAVGSDTVSVNDEPTDTVFNSGDVGSISLFGLWLATLMRVYTRSRSLKK